MSAPRIVLAVGFPGAGKSTWFAQRGIAPLSSDQMRLLLADDEDCQTIHIEVFESIRYLLEMRIRIGRPVSYVDATNLMRIYREPYVELARKHGCTIEALWFDVPIEDCLARNNGRTRRVPEEVMREMARTFEPPTEDEGFSVVTRIEI